MGEKAAEAIRNIFTPDELTESAAGYTKSELIKLGIIEQPKAEKVTADGKFGVGAQIKGSYLYIGEKSEGETVCGFEAADTEDGEFKKITDGNLCSIVSGHEGKYIRFFVTPVNAEGIKGSTYYTKAYKVSGKASVSAEKIKVTDKNGKEISDLSSVDRMDVSVNLVNCTKSPKKAWVMLFVYDKDGKMLDNRGVSVTVDADSEKLCDSLSLQLLAYVDGNYAKLFIWDGLETMSSAQNGALIFK